MPTSANVSLPLVPPRSNALSGEQTEKRLRRDSAVQEPAKSPTSEWIDIEDKPTKRRRRIKRAQPVVDSPKSVSRTQTQRFSGGSDLGRFLPKLAQILETSDSKSQSRQQQRSLHDTRKPARAKDVLINQRDASLQLNASLLSVISGLTSATERSSGSNSTVTQRSYRRRSEHFARRSHSTQHRAMSDTSSMRSIASSRARMQFAYRDTHNPSDEQQSALSSSMSSHGRSEYGSSDAPGTPSSHSAYSSPGPSQQADERRHKSTGSRDVPSIALSTIESVAGSELSRACDGSYESSISEDGAYPYGEPDVFVYEHAQQPLPAPMPAHPSAFSAQYLEQMHRSHSHGSAGPGQPPQQALQHYFDHRAPLESDDEVLHLMHQGARQDILHQPPPVPDAPDVHARSIMGYEKLALELSSTESAVRPMYRKFEFLNHRLLLHLQDELAELEEQLRVLDEMIAQMEPMEGDKYSPASRRRDAYYGTEIHHHRKILLGNIFFKTEQYNKAMSSYSAMLRDCVPAHESDVRVYRAWLDEETPIHELETKFLTNNKDLIIPGARGQSPKPQPVSTMGMLILPMILVLPTAMFTLVPSLVGRFALILAMSLAWTGLRATTSLFSGLSRQEFMMTLAAFVLLTSVMALAMPQAVE